MGPGIRLAVLVRGADTPPEEPSRCGAAWFRRRGLIPFIDSPATDNDEDVHEGRQTRADPNDRNPDE